MGKLFQIYISLLNLVGTITSVWSVIRISFDGLSKSTSAANIFHPDLKALKTKRDAQKRLFIVILAFIYGTVNNILNIKNGYVIVALIFLYVVLICINNKLMNALFNATLIAYDDYLIKNGKESLISQLKEDNRKKFEKLKNDRQPFKYITSRYAQDDDEIK